MRISDWSSDVCSSDLAKPASLRERMAPLRNLQVWRFSLYYFLVFGGFIALASWLPRYYMGVYGVDLRTAGMLAASFALPATLFRAVGGVLAEIGRAHV